jgi:GNAT superfamily N-acetyltransferase
MDGGEISVRDALPGDAAALELVHADVARYYSRAAPHYFRAAVLSGITGERTADRPSDDDMTLRLVAEVNGEIVGALAARLLQSADGQERPDAQPAERRLRIEYLATAAGSRRGGIGTRLVEAAEAWGRQAGATIVETTTFQDSPLSVPFWEDRMGYEELALTLEKRL